MITTLYVVTHGYAPSPWEERAGLEQALNEQCKLPFEHFTGNPAAHPYVRIECDNLEAAQHLDTLVRTLIDEHIS